LIKNPVVTIGLPVFNGAKYLKLSLDSILAQTFNDFELILSDNASSDETQLICQEYALRDNRIKYHRNKCNVGIAANHNIVLGLSTGKYFKWAAYDDILAPTFLEECVKVLDNNSSIVICQSKTGQIDKTGQITGYYEFGFYPSSRIDKRFANIISMRNEAYLLLLGLIRTSELRQTKGMGNYISADRALLGELSLYGSITVIPNILFYRRHHSEAYTEKHYKDLAEKQSAWTGNERSRMVFPYLKILIEYIKIIKRSPQSWFSRQKCFFQVFIWLIKEGWFLMAIDLGLNMLNNNKHILKILTPLSARATNRFFNKAS
jgi:glycosyltransferase involved in cell wall biosynthesis